MDADAGCQDDQDVSTRDDRDTDDYDSDDDDGETRDEEDELKEPIDAEGVPRCVSCAGEVVEGACHFCATEHIWVPVSCSRSNVARRRLYLTRQKLYEESNATDSHAVGLDRSLVPRGDTPLCDATMFKKPPHGYSKADYTHLLKRGANRLMVETFALEFTPEDGYSRGQTRNSLMSFPGPR